MGPSVPVEDDAIGVYKIEITETMTGTEKYFIELTQEIRKVRPESDPPERKPDVWVSLLLNCFSLLLILQAYKLKRLLLDSLNISRLKVVGKPVAYPRKDSLCSLIKAGILRHGRHEHSSVLV